MSQGMVDRGPEVGVVVGRFDPLMRPGLAEALGEGRAVRIRAIDVEDAKLEALVLRHLPRVVILDERAARAMLECLREVAPATGVLVLAHEPSREYGMHVLAAGATCLASNLSTEDLLAAVERVAQGERMFIAPDGRRVVRRYPSDAPPLTPREVEVLEHLSRNRSNAEIALALKIGVETVRTYVARVLRKLGKRSRQELIGVPIQPRPGRET
jgi:DNA-binding NarL/FixJ family response regulator